MTGRDDPALPAVWREPFALAWEALRAGSRPVGAVLVDARGHVVARGRNRSQEAAATAPPGQLAGAAIAHAEVNVLGQLTAARRYEDHRLFTTLEPCLLCSGALLHAHVGTVFYAAPDPLWQGIERIPSVSGAIAERWTRRVGPVQGPLAVFGALLMDLWSLRHDAPPSGGERAFDHGAQASARRCAEIPGFTEAETVAVAYRLALPHLSPYAGDAGGSDDRSNDRSNDR
ncbi:MULTISPECIES: nucleoside deaminase [unclassified Streptomyces]|uniref:nucleoside deaminase n=1 Tax=unclassified Streptomyces TaxID=2593676 RepID=UPI0033E709F4